MSEMAPQQDFREQRAAERHPAPFCAILIECDMFGEQSEIVNIARLGFLARTRLMRMTGDALRLHIPDLGVVEAHVVWCANGMFGGRFCAPIDAQGFDRFLATLS